MSEPLEIFPLCTYDALLLMESMDNPFHIGAPEYRPLTDEQKAGGITEYREHDLDHGKEGKLIIFKRNRSHEIHHEDWDDEGNPKSGEMITRRSGANPRYVATMAHVAKTLLGQGKSVRIVGTVSNGMFKKYRAIGAILAKRHGFVLTPEQKYTVDHPDADDMKEFTIHKQIGESMPFWLRRAALKNATRENDYFVGECFVTNEVHFENTVK